MLLVAATRAEIGPTLEYLAPYKVGSMGDHYVMGNLQVGLCISGVGLMATTYALTRAVPGDKYDLILQVGIAGSFDPALPLGETVWITTEMLGDQGAEDNGAYLDTFELGLAEPDAAPFENRALPTPHHEIHKHIRLPKVSGLTVNAVSGHMPTIDLRRSKYGCQVESMEGATLHYVCLQLGVPFAQVRTISNYVTPRDKNTWELGMAVKNLNEWLGGFLQEISAL